MLDLALDLRPSLVFLVFLEFHLFFQVLFHLLGMVDLTLLLLE